jgi:hypothetical protein
MGSSSREDEVAQALERGSGIEKMGGGSRSRKKMAKAVSQKYAFVAGTHVPSGHGRTGLAGQLGHALWLCSLGHE